MIKRRPAARILVLSIPDCDGIGFGLDILPVDPNYRDERGGFITDDDFDEEDR